MLWLVDREIWQCLCAVFTAAIVVLVVIACDTHGICVPLWVKSFSTNYRAYNTKLFLQTTSNVYSIVSQSSDDSLVHIHNLYENVKHYNSICIHLTRQPPNWQTASADQKQMKAKPL